MVTINVALGSGADTQATKGKIAIRPLAEHVVTDGPRRFLVLGAWEDWSLNTEPIQWSLTPGELYEVREIEPRGKTRVFQAPSVATDYGDLDWLEEAPGTGGGYTIEPATWVLLSTEDLPAAAEPGQTYYETDTNIFGKVGA